MTNNGELALKIKAAAEKASGGEWVRESGEGWEAICSDDDQVNGGFIICSFQGNDDESNRKFVQGASPANILALLAERDADKKRIAELEREKEAMTAAALAMRDDMRDARSLLEARTVSVPTFEEYQPDIARELQGAFRIACTDAGIKLEVGE